jgi:hypothetical protein
VAGWSVPVLDELLWEVVPRRWEVSGGAPKRLMLLLDSTVVRRYGLKQAGAEKGYNPQRPGCPSHHPLLAFAGGDGGLPGGDLESRQRPYR